ncbi:MAG: FAD-binding oxidoreductase, partial [Chloroflexota bacterium]
VHKAGKDILKLCLEMGGTLTGEHGIGLEKQDSMALQFGPDELFTMGLIKKTFDPNNMLNPNKLLPNEQPSGMGVQ